MSNRRRLRPSICRAVTPDGRLLVAPARYRDPGVYVPAGTPLNLTPKPRERRFRPGGRKPPVNSISRASSYLTSSGRRELTGRQWRRILVKVRRDMRSEGELS